MCDMLQHGQLSMNVVTSFRMLFQFDFNFVFKVCNVRFTLPWPTVPL